jgi:hypothetical protein
MDITQVLFAKSLQAATPEEQLVYVYLFADAYESHEVSVEAERNVGRFTSTMTEEALHRVTNLSVAAIRRSLSGLTKRRWIKLVDAPSDKKYCLGLIKLEDSQITVELLLEIPAIKRSLGKGERVTKLRHQLEESKQRIAERREKNRPQLSSESKRRIAATLLPTTITRKPGAATRLFDCLASAYWKKYKEAFEQTVAGKKPMCLKMLGNLLKYTFEDEAAATAHLCYCVENWEKIQEGLGGKKSSRPSLNSLCSKRFFEVVADFRKNGIPTRVKSNYADTGQRYNKSIAEESPDHGF